VQVGQAQRVLHGSTVAQRALYYLIGSLRALKDCMEAKVWALTGGIACNEDASAVESDAGSTSIGLIEV